MRLFFGLSLPASIRQAVSERASACQEAIPGRYVPKENYHITLAFLGNVPEHRAGEAAAVLAQCVKTYPAPRLTLGETAFFGRAQNAILITRIHCEPPLDPLHAALGCALEDAGLPFDSGPFSPHITLARRACPGGIALPAGDALSFVPDCAHLYLSARNAQDVLTYTPIASAAFGQ